MNSKPIIAFATGGFSGEAVVSYASAKTIEAHLDREKYHCITVDFRPDGWFARQPEGEFPIDKNNFTFIDAAGKTISFDAVLIGIHGSPGEDGKLQGYFDLLNIPYTSCDTGVSALTFNKRFTVSVAAFSGVRVANSKVIYSNIGYDVDELAAYFSYPVFVKPNNGGSSIGMTKVTEPKKLAAAIELAFKEDHQVMIEEMIKGRELTVGVFKAKDILHILPATEIIPKTEYFDYQAKYEKGMCDEITPAQIGDVATEQLRSAVKILYEAFNLRGIVRMDFIYNTVEEVHYLLEINTVPGQTATSLVPQQLAAYGWTLKRFYSAQIDEALDKHGIK